MAVNPSNAFALAAEVNEIGIRHCGRGLAVKLRLEIDDAGRFRHWQRPKQNRIRQAEHY
jgi:hypothetical protein